MATAQRLTALGARVAIVGRDHDKCVAAAEALGGVGFGADVRDASQVTTAFEAAHRALGALDVVVLSAGIARGGKVGEVTDEVYREMVATNVDGVFYGVRTAARLMGERGGAVVAIASFGGVVPTPTDRAVERGCTRRARPAGRHLAGPEQRGAVAAAAGPSGPSGGSRIQHHHRQHVIGEAHHAHGERVAGAVRGRGVHPEPCA